MVCCSGYLVYYTTDPTQDDRDWVVEGVMGDKLSTTIRDLTSDTTYFFKVQARNSKGYGPMSPTVIFRTPKGEFSIIERLVILLGVCRRTKFSTELNVITQSLILLNCNYYIKVWHRNIWYFIKH